MMFKKSKRALVIGIAAAMMMASVTGCSEKNNTTSTNTTAEVVVENEAPVDADNKANDIATATDQAADVNKDETKDEAEVVEDSEDMESTGFYDSEGNPIRGEEIEDPANNSASSLIKDLKSPVTAENIAEYDYTEKAMEYLNYIGTNLKNRDSQDPEKTDHDKTVEWILSELKSAGFTDDQIVEQNVDEAGTKIHNIILTVPGEDDSKQIIAGAHYDGDGTGDNGSGTALLLANAVGLKDKKPHYTTKYIFFDSEEIGLYGSLHYVDSMTKEEIDNTIYMINMDALSFGDYANVYGGLYTGMDQYLKTDDRIPPATEAYDYAMQNAKNLGFNVQGTKELDGCFQKNGKGPEIEDNTLYTNPWTAANPAPSNVLSYSPATIPASDHVGFMVNGIEYIYFEATNWFAASDKNPDDSYTGYIETYDQSLGDGGMFMNTEYDTLENLESLFPGRAEAHFHMYSPLLSSLLLSQ